MSRSLRVDGVDELDRRRALADGRGDALHAAGADVADGEDAGDAGLERIGGARQRPLRRRELLVAEVDAGLHEPLLVDLEAAVEPLGVGTRAGHQEEVAHVARLALARLLVAPRDALETSVAADLVERSEEHTSELQS